MLAKGLERVFIVAYVLILVGTTGVLFLQDPPGAPRYWGVIYLAVALAPLTAWSWVRGQFAVHPLTTALSGLAILWVWSSDAQHGRFDFTLVVAPVIIAAVWALRGFSRKETQDGSV